MSIEYFLDVFHVKLWPNQLGQTLRLRSTQSITMITLIQKIKTTKSTICLS